MNEARYIINNFSQYSSWLRTLEELDSAIWFKPIAKGKWSVSEIVAHLMKWDQHLISEVLPSVRNEKGMEFPGFDTFNKTASDYAKSGISKFQLIEEAKDTREQLVRELNELSVEKLDKPLPCNGVTLCPHTGTPYSLLYIVKEFTDHDHHHMTQIKQFINENDLD